MKTKLSRLFTVAAFLISTASFVSCGGASGSSATSNSQSFNEADVIGDYADLPAVGSTNYGEIFKSVKNTKDHDIVNLLRMDPNFSTFNKLAQMSNLDLKLVSASPVTVFAPTNEAFKKMPEERFEKLVDPRNRAQLGRFIQRHVLPTSVSDVRFNDSQIITTSTDEEIRVNTMNGNAISIGGATIMRSNIQASNGIIHVVDAIIQPGSDVVPE